ncbi:39S ribosomal protein L50, mitochondrial [Perognathus longimembris pacificus]|uniref:39S ribosomal protein L50, mitochondrial n=1 Tax=Perognathus longimembris pacificus TaxID=214514 RepID=UPI002019720C|nr:39S ribosomal protein L50, mitochondrial [Perognathus longimembris pacificus]
MASATKLAPDWLRDRSRLRGRSRFRLSLKMAAFCVSGIAGRDLTRIFLGATRREFWSLSRKEKEPVVAAPVEEIRKEPVLVCPPLRSRAYTPPEDLQSRVESRLKEVLGSSVPSDWQDISVEDGHVKFSLLAHLADDLGHAVPNSRLHQMCRVRDIVDFYKVPVKDISKFDELTASNLPPNLKITWGY